jgi:hypothetical protein
MGKLTKEQEDLIKQYSCERLSSHPDNYALRFAFSCKKGRPLVEYLQSKAWEEDMQSQTAFYLIKTPSGNPALFFSHKCGSLERT